MNHARAYAAYVYLGNMLADIMLADIMLADMDPAPARESWSKAMAQYPHNVELRAE
jgi:hypothetical protein